MASISLRRRWVLYLSIRAAISKSKLRSVGPRGLKSGRFLVGHRLGELVLVYKGESLVLIFDMDKVLCLMTERPGSVGLESHWPCLLYTSPSPRD